MGFVAPLVAAIGGSSILGGIASGVGTAVGTSLLGKALGLGPKKPQMAPSPMSAPSAPRSPMTSNATGSTAFFPASEGTQGGTFLTGKATAPSLGGQKKTLLGQ